MKILQTPSLPELDLRHFISKSSVQTRSLSGCNYAAATIPKPVADRFDIQAGDRLYWFDQEGHMNVPHMVAKNYDWVFVAIEKRRDTS